MSYIISTLILSIIVYNSGAYEIKDYFIFAFLVIAVAFIFIFIIKEWKMPPVTAVILFALHIMNYRSAVAKYDKSLSWKDDENLIFIYNVVIFTMALIFYFLAVKSHNKNKALE